MTTKTPKGSSVPQAGDGLLDAWTNYDASVGIISQFASIAAMRTGLAAAEAAGTPATANHPWYMDNGSGIIYRATGGKGNDNVYDLVPINVVEGHDDVANVGLKVTRPAGSQHEIVRSKLPVRPYRRMVLVIGMCNASVSGTVGLRTLISNKEGNTARWETNADAQTQMSVNIGFVEAGADPQVIMAASFGGTTNSTLTVSSAADAVRLCVLAFPVTMAS